MWSTAYIKAFYLMEVDEPIPFRIFLDGYELKHMHNMSPVEQLSPLLVKRRGRKWKGRSGRSSEVKGCDMDF